MMKHSMIGQKFTQKHGPKMRNCRPNSKYMLLPYQQEKHVYLQVKQTGNILQTLINNNNFTNTKGLLNNNSQGKCLFEQMI